MVHEYRSTAFRPECAESCSPPVLNYVIVSRHVFFQGPLQIVGIKSKLKVSLALLVGNREMVDERIAGFCLVPKVYLTQFIVLAIPAHAVRLQVTGFSIIEPDY